MPQTCQISGSKTWQESLPGWALVLGIGPCGDWTCEWPCCVMLVRNGIYSEYSIPMYMRYIAYMRYYILYVVHVYIMCTMVDLHTALLDYMWTFTLSSQYVSQAQDSLGSSPASTKITFGHLRLLWPDIPIKKRGDFP